jgi:hypothetical protein
VIWNVPNDREKSLIDLTSLDDHSYFYWDYDDVSQSEYSTMTTVVDIEKQTYIFSRFHVANIMHTLHDDFIGLYHTIRQFSQESFDDSRPEVASNKI